MERREASSRVVITAHPRPLPSRGEGCEVGPWARTTEAKGAGRLGQGGG
jgi:hypothetical protein